VGGDGTAIGGNGPPTRAANWVPVPGLNPYRLVAGHAPRADDQVVINRGAAIAGHLRIGDRTRLLVPSPVRVMIVGLATFGTADGFGPSTFTGMTLHAAQRYLTNDPARVGSVLIEASPGVTADRLLRALRPVLPSGVQAVTGGQLTREDLDTIDSGFLGFLRTALTVFAVVALVVAAFSIYNTFSILAAQRTRSSALLRALGATRRQVVLSSLTETVVVGAVGSGVGLAAGVGLAVGLKAAFDGFGFSLPAGGLVLSASTALIAVVAGLTATVIAGAMPAWRAARVAPLAALRDAAVESATTSTGRVVIGSLLIAAGIGATVWAAFSETIGVAGLGALAMLAGAVVAGPGAARPVVTAMGAPLASLRGMTGRLARRNATRNPRRTASTASALMIGVAVVSLFTVVGTSLKASASAGIDRSLRADLVVDTGGYGGRSGGAGLSPDLISRIRGMSGVRFVTGLGGGTALLAGTSREITTADPAAVGRVLDLGIMQGVFGGDGGNRNESAFAVSRTAADDAGWRLGSAVSITYPDGATGRLRVSAIYEQADIAGDYVVAAQAWASHAGQPMERQILVDTLPGQVGSTQRAMTTLADSYGLPRVQTRAQFRASATEGVNTILGLIYVMLTLAIVIALMGIGNTLALSVRERTRELGLLRAVGQTRSQARSMVRWESVLIASFGTLCGVLLGTFLGWSLTKAASGVRSPCLRSPWARSSLIVGALAGILAGIRPSRRAARIPVIAAIAE
jgi:putative ABC transport system permease protein